MKKNERIEHKNDELSLNELLNEVDCTWKLYEALLLRWFDNEQIVQELLDLYNQ